MALMALGLLVSLAVGMVRGGRLDRLVEFEFRAFWAVIAAFALQYLLNSADATRPSPVVSFFIPIHVAVYAILGYALWVNLATPGVKVIAAGVALNFLVIAVNGMRMPVSVDVMRWAGMPSQVAFLETGKALTHVALEPATRLKFLGDVLAIPRPFPSPSAFSFGDVLMLVGVFILVQAAMLGPAAKASDGAA